MMDSKLSLWPASRPPTSVNTCSLPNEILDLIVKQFGDDSLSRVCLALACKDLFQLYGKGELLCAAMFRRPRVLFKRRDPPTRNKVFNSIWWKLLLFLEDSRYRCCAGCLVLHPIDQFSTSDLETEAECRTCVFGPLVGVLDLCPCFRMTFRQKIKITSELRTLMGKTQAAIAVEERDPETSANMLFHECHGWGVGKGKSVRDLKEKTDIFRALTLPSVMTTGDNYLHSCAFQVDEGSGPHCYTCRFEDEQIVEKKFTMILNNDGNLYLESEYSHWAREDEDGSPFYGELLRNPVFICPHRSFYQLASDLYHAVFDREGDYDRHYISIEDATNRQRSLLTCKYCDTQVQEFSTRRNYGQGPHFCWVRTLRNLGKATDKADDVWNAQTVPSFEVPDAVEKKDRSPWTTWITRTTAGS